jgi:Tfp pilus assembly protein PilF
LDIIGTSANLDSANQFNDDLVWQKIDIPYIGYLEKTMFYMNQRNMKKALARFDVILETYSDDINALFYSGFAFYNLNEFEKSKNKFEEALQSKISNFDEEAIWHLAFSYEKSGETSKAKDLFKTIASSESFYAEMARKKL